MAFRGWRLFGLAGTIFIYVAGILLLSIISLQNSGQRRPRIKDRDLVNLHRREVFHNALNWCRQLTFSDGTPMANRPLDIPPKRIHRSPSKAQGESPGNDTKGSAPFDGVYSRTRRKLEAQSKREPQEEVKGLTALVSFPGSGNTWIRYLLQQSTGVLTGSVYKDLGLMKSGFPAESISNKSVIVVKTHEWGEKSFKMFSTAVLIVREPGASILAEFNRQSAGHVGFASVDRFTRTDGRYWNQFVTNKLTLWENTNLSWALDFKGRLKIVFYEDLVANTEEVIRDILHFIGHKVDDSLIKCAMLHKEGIYRRRKRIVHFDPFTKEMHQRIADKTKDVYRKLGRLQ